MKIEKILNYTDFEKYFKEIKEYYEKRSLLIDNFYKQNPNELGSNRLNDKIHLFNLEFNKITQFNLKNNYDLFTDLNKIFINLEYDLIFFYNLDNLTDFYNITDFKGFTFNIENQYYIIIDFENKKILNINENNIKNILIRLFKDYNLKFNTNLNINDIDKLIDLDYSIIDKIEKELKIPDNYIYDLY